jgi:hypothetical protein
MTSPIPKVNVQYIQTVCGCGGGGVGGRVLSYVLDQILGLTLKIVTLPHTKITSKDAI